MTFAPKPVEQDISLDHIDPNGGTQMRTRIDDAVVAEYAERMAAGDEFPPIVVFREGKKFWLADGFHRFRARRACSARDVRALVHVGDRSDAIEYAIGANKSNGLRRTNDDKRMAVRAALAHERLRERGNVEIAEMVGVSDEMVRKMRSGESAQPPSVGGSSQAPAMTRIGKDGRRRRLPSNPRPTPAPKLSTKPAIPSVKGNTAEASPPAPKRAALLGHEDMPCPHCNGTGRIRGRN